MRISDWSSDVCSSDLASNPTLHRPPHPIGKLRMTTLHFFEHRHGPDSKRRLQQRYNFAIEDIRQRIGAPATARLFLLRGHTIGRASCQERWTPYGKIQLVAVTTKTTDNAPNQHH